MYISTVANIANIVGNCIGVFVLDLGAAGRGDRHFDLFWGRWSLQYNLKTDRHREGLP